MCSGTVLFSSCAGHSLILSQTLLPPADALRPHPTMKRHFNDRSSDSLVSVGSIGAVPIHDHSPQMSGSNSDIEKIMINMEQASRKRSRRQQTETPATQEHYYAELAKQLPDSKDTSNMPNIDILKHSEFKCASH